MSQPGQGGKQGVARAVNGTYSLKGGVHGIQEYGAPDQRRKMGIRTFGAEKSEMPEDTAFSIIYKPKPRFPAPGRVPAVLSGLKSIGTTPLFQSRFWDRAIAERKLPEFTACNELQIGRAHV